MADLNGDGRADVLSGSWPGGIFLFRREADGSFAPGEKVMDRSGQPLQAGRGTAVFAADWDSDGDLDLVVGNVEGQVFLVPNEGTANEPLFGSRVPLSAGGQPIRSPGGDAGPSVADWDRDGKPDLILGTGSGAVLWYRNEGAPGKPELAAPQVLVPPAPTGRSRGEAESGGGPCGRRSEPGRLRP